VHPTPCMTTAESVVRPHTSSLYPDRRERVRASLELPVLVDTLHSWQRARCQNVSASGVALVCEEPIPIGTTVTLYFELPSGVAVETEACVVRANGRSLGLHFVRLDRETEVAIRAHCRVAAAR